VVDLDPQQAAGRGFLHEDVAADVAQFGGHFLTVLGERLGDVNFGVDGADRFRMIRIADQTNRFAGNAQANGDFRAHRNEIEVLSEGPTAQARLLVPAIETHLGAHQAGADRDFGFGGSNGHRSTSNLNLYRTWVLYNMPSS